MSKSGNDTGRLTTWPSIHLPVVDCTVGSIFTDIAEILIWKREKKKTVAPLEPVTRATIIKFNLCPEIHRLLGFIIRQRHQQCGSVWCWWRVTGALTNDRSWYYWCFWAHSDEQTFDRESWNLSWHLENMTTTQEHCIQIHTHTQYTQTLIGFHQEKSKAMIAEPMIVCDNRFHYFFYALFFSLTIQESLLPVTLLTVPVGWQLSCWRENKHS